MTSLNTQRRVTAALLLSLGLNLFFIGGIATRFAFGPGMPAASNQPLPPTLGWIVNDLEPARRSELRGVMLQGVREAREARARVGLSQRETTRLMQASPFDQTALKEAFAELRSASNDFQEIAHRQTAAALSKLSPEERERAVQFLARRGPRERNFDGRPPRAPGRRELPSNSPGI